MSIVRLSAGHYEVACDRHYIRVRDRVEGDRWYASAMPTRAHRREAARSRQKRGRS